MVKRKRLWGAIKGAAAALALVVASSSIYRVDQTQQAVITQFGKPVRIIANPIERKDREERIKRLKEKYSAEGIKVSEGAGLRFKAPFIQSVNKFDRRLLRWNGYPEQIPTKDKKYIWVDSTARWYIEDPLQYLRSVGTEEQAHARLDDIIDSTTRNSITKRDLIEIVRTDNREMKVAEEELKETTKVGKVYEGRPKIVAEITVGSRKACEEYGIDIHEEGVLIKGLTYVQTVKEKVEDRMIEERLRISKKYISEGDGAYQKIMGDKDREVKRILSEAYKIAREIEGTADAEAVDIYANGFTEKDKETEKEIRYVGFNANPEFYRFWRTLQLYEGKVGGEKTRLIVGTENPLFKFLKGEVKNQATTKPSE